MQALYIFSHQYSNIANVLLCTQWVSICFGWDTIDYTHWVVLSYNRIVDTSSVHRSKRVCNNLDEDKQRGDILHKVVSMIKTCLKFNMIQLLWQCFCWHMNTPLEVVACDGANACCYLHRLLYYRSVDGYGYSCINVHLTCSRSAVVCHNVRHVIHKPLRDLVTVGIGTEYSGFVRFALWNLWQGFVVCWFAVIRASFNGFTRHIHIFSGFLFGHRRNRVVVFSMSLKLTTSLLSSPNHIKHNKALTLFPGS